MRLRPIKLFTVFGVPIRLDPTWFLILVLVAGLLANFYFPSRYMGLDGWLYWTLGVVAAIMLFVCVLLHELGHSLAARRNNIAVRGVTLFFFGGISELSEEPSSASAEARVTLSGWLVSAALAVIFFMLARLVKGTSQMALGTQALLEYLCFVNLFLFGFNGLPGLPLDGGRLLRAALWRITGNLRKATYIASRAGVAFGMVLMLFGFFAILSGPKNIVGGLFTGMLGLFLMGAANASYRQVLVRRALEGVPVSEIMSRDLLSVAPSVSLGELVDDYFMRYRFHSIPVMEGDTWLGMVNWDEVRSVERERWADTAAGQVLEREDDISQLSPEDDAVHALGLMAREDVGRVPVVQDSKLVGILTRRDIMRLLSMKTELDK